MIKAEFQPTLFSKPKRVHTTDPYVKLEIFRRDPENIYMSPCNQWAASSTSVYRQKYKGADIVGLHAGRSLTSATLTNEINVGKDGKYWILLRVLKTPQSKSQTIALDIDGETVKKINTYSPWMHYKFLDFGHIELEAGAHTFEVSLDGKRTWVDHLLMYRLEYFSSEETNSEYRLDWESIEFTENSLGELNSCEITLPMREAWNDPNANIFSRKVFEFGDIINVIVGKDWNDAKVKFGGYVIGYDESDDGKISISAADRLLDLYRRPTYTNYFIGLAPTSNDTNVFTNIKFATAFEAIRHASETSEYGLLNYGISYPYTLYKNFKNRDDYDNTEVTGFIQSYSETTGLKLRYSETSEGQLEAILFNDPNNPVDAITDNMLCLEYLVSGQSCGIQNRMQFDIMVEMYKSGQTEADATEYTILFTGANQYENPPIGRIKPELNGTIEMGKIDLKQAFDKKAPSSHYYITKISLKGNSYGLNDSVKKNSSFNILSLTAYESRINTKMKVNQETSYPYENIQEILENMKFLAWVDYGRTRAEDVLCIAPEMNEVSSVIADENINVLNITDKSYAPKDTIRNRKMAHYHYKSGKTEKTGVSYKENLDSVARYGPGAWEIYEDLTDVSKKADADILTQNFVEENSYPIVSFTLEIEGTTVLNPSQYIVTKLQSDYLMGEYSTKTVTHTITRDAGYITKISVNRPGSYYDQIMMKLDNNLRKYLGFNSQGMYGQNSLNNMNLSGLGAFIRSGY